MLRFDGTERKSVTCVGMICKISGFVKLLSVRGDVARELVVDPCVT